MHVPCDNFDQLRRRIRLQLQMIVCSHGGGTSVSPSTKIRLVGARRRTMSGVTTTASPAAPAAPAAAAIIAVVKWFIAIVVVVVDEVDAVLIVAPFVAFVRLFRRECGRR